MAQTLSKTNNGIFTSTITSRQKVLAVAVSRCRNQARERCLHLYEKTYGGRVL